jgi:hypothetical protein
VHEFKFGFRVSQKLQTLSAFVCVMFIMHCEHWVCRCKIFIRNIYTRSVLVYIDVVYRLRRESARRDIFIRNVSINDDLESPVQVNLPRFMTAPTVNTVLHNQQT